MLFWIYFCLAIHPSPQLVNLHVQSVFLKQMWKCRQQTHSICCLTSEVLIHVFFFSKHCLPHLKLCFCSFDFLLFSAIAALLRLPSVLAASFTLIAIHSSPLANITVKVTPKTSWTSLNRHSKTSLMCTCMDWSCKSYFFIVILMSFNKNHLVDWLCNW